MGEGVEQPAEGGVDDAGDDAAHCGAGEGEALTASSRCLVVIRSATCRKPSEVRTIGAARHPDDVPAPLRQGGVSCRCASGEPHESPALTLTEGGRTKTITLAAAEVREVEAAPARYQAARTELDAQAEADLARLQGRHRGGADTAGRCR